MFVILGRFWIGLSGGGRSFLWRRDLAAASVRGEEVEQVMGMETEEKAEVDLKL